MNNIPDRAAAGQSFEQIAQDTGADRRSIRDAVHDWALHEALAAPARQLRRRKAPKLRAVKAPRDRKQRDWASLPLAASVLALTGLAGGAAYVSYSAQFTLVYRFKPDQAVAHVQAAIPDAGAIVFAFLAVALAVQGGRAIGPRTLNVLCVGLSVAMNALAAAHGWKALLVWIMAPAIYALASDRLVAVIRAYAVARKARLNSPLADEGTTLLDVLLSVFRIAGAVLVWLLRLSLDPRGTLGGFRKWVLTTPASPRPVPIQPPKVIKVIKTEQPKAVTSGPREGSKTSRMIALAESERDLRTIPINEVSRLATAKGEEVGLDGGAARAALLKHVRALQNGSKS